MLFLVISLISIRHSTVLSCSPKKDCTETDRTFGLSGATLSVQVNYITFLLSIQRFLARNL
nr:MAG TPA: hypothetical protein [Caudoviricetes sp.]